MTIRQTGLAVFAAGSFALLSTPAAAETLPISGTYAAGSDAPSEFRTIVIERFDGNEGTKFELELRDAMARAVIDGAAYYDVRRGIGPDEGATQTAWISGAALSEVERLPSGTAEERKCVREDKDGKCVERRTFTYTCRELAVRFTGEVLMLDGRDELVYDRGYSTSGSQRYCENQSSVPSASDMVTGMIERFAREVRRDLAPTQRNEDIRVLESRDGMAKSLRKSFKKALNLTKSDWGAACAEFDRLNALQPDHITLTFNAGLCREVVGDLDRAQELYSRSLGLEPGKDYPTAGLSRIASRRRAQQQLALHHAGPEDAQLAHEDHNGA